MYTLLSYAIGKQTPVFKYSPPIVIYGHRLIERGDRYNNYRIELWNHHGTHIDGPNHINDSWKHIAEFPIESFMFDRPCVVEMRASDNEQIGPDALERSLGKTADDPDLVMIRTGFCEIREKEPGRYTGANPGLSPDGARYLLDRFPRMRALGIDTFSSGPIQKFEESAQTHMVLLDPTKPRSDRMIIEDMRIPARLSGLKRVWAIPLFVEGIDSAWCTVVAET